jgi:hypothetical protein
MQAILKTLVSRDIEWTLTYCQVSKKPWMDSKDEAVPSLTPKNLE